MTETPIWRQALNDSDHPLSNIAWLLFSERTSWKTFERIPEEKREGAAQIALAILQTPALYEESALGGGIAPRNSINMLQVHKDVRTIPIIFDILAGTEDDDVWDGLFSAVYGMCEQASVDATEPLLATGEKHFDNLDIAVSVSSCLSIQDEEYPRILDFMKRVFVRTESEYHVRLMVNNLLLYDFELSEDFLNEQMQTEAFEQHQEVIKQGIIRWREH